MGTRCIFDTDLPAFKDFPTVSLHYFPTASLRYCALRFQLSIKMLCQNLRTCSPRNRD
jgi:hypothetical protein